MSQRNDRRACIRRHTVPVLRLRNANVCHQKDSGTKGLQVPQQRPDSLQMNTALTCSGRNTCSYPTGVLLPERCLQPHLPAKSEQRHERQMTEGIINASRRPVVKEMWNKAPGTGDSVKNRTEHDQTVCPKIVLRTLQNLKHKKTLSNKQTKITIMGSNYSVGKWKERILNYSVGK